MSDSTSTQKPNTAPIPLSVQARVRLRTCWLSFNDLRDKIRNRQNQGETHRDNPLGRSLSTEHRRALDDLITVGEIDAPAANVLQEAYDAAIYHIWRSNVGMTCYRPMPPHFGPASARQLIEQSAVLAQMAEEDHLDPKTVAVAQKAIEHDMAFEALTRKEVVELYQKSRDKSQLGIEARPSFDKMPFVVIPKVLQAAQFLVDLLTER